MRRSGFTLVEVVVAVAILGVVAAIVATALTGSVNVQAAADRRTETSHAARTALDRVSQELQSAFARRAGQSAGAAPGKASAPAPGGLVLEDREVEGLPADRLQFFTYGRPLGAADERASDQAVLEYALVASDDRRHWRLVRRQSPQLDLASLAEAPGDIVADGVVGFDVRVHDGKEWRTEWPNQGKLPAAVSITVRLVPEPPPGARRPWGEGRVEEARLFTYGTKTVLPLGPPPAPGAAS